MPKYKLTPPRIVMFLILLSVGSYLFLTGEFKKLNTYQTVLTIFLFIALTVLVFDKIISYFKK
ncbi:hypothetical protein DCC35_16630 [Mangrovivirga cuniculi]|uniref:Uncharacterized protein n=1 Tax=Mangrovivirga cuniculi TaxID=2715131 RepID=A0A4D7JRU9_9BACT|nr:hypothetical protein DCC35_16630 [Mangrovivirga cuniculi]